MRPQILILLLFALLLASCAKKKASVVACAGVNKNLSATDGLTKANMASDKDAHFFRRHKRSAKAQDGFRKKEKKQKSSRVKAEKGKKKEKKEGKVERKFHLFRKKREADKATDAEDEKLFHTNPKKRKKEIRKKSKHPEMGLFPKGMKH